MGSIVFKKDDIYLLKPTEIRKTGKQVKSAKFGGMCEIYKIDFEDRTKNTGTAEYLCVAGECTEFTVGVPRYVRCSWVADRGDATVEPCEDPNEKPIAAPHKQPAEGVLTRNEEKIRETIDTRYTPAPNPYNVQVGGRAIVFTTGFAKDLKVAEINTRGWNAKVTDEDIEDIIRWAGKMATGMIDRMDF